MINILHLTHTDIISDSRILKEMQCLSKSNKDYKLFGIGIDRNEDRKSTMIQNLEIYSLNLKTRKWVILPNSIKHIFTLIEFYIKLIYIAIKIKPDVVHSHDILALPAGFIIKLLNKSRLIYDAHELESEKNGISILTSKIIFISEKILWKYIDKLIVVGPSIAAWYEKKIGNKNIEIIMNAPFIEKDHNIKEKKYLRHLFKIPITSKTFIYIGAFLKGRGIEQLIEVFKDEKVKSHIVFLGYGELKNIMLEESVQCQKIHIHDAVPHEKIISIAKSADVGLCFIQNISLSDYYCLPNKLFEYAFSGISVLASNFPDIVSVVEKYNLGRCCSVDYDSIYSKIKEFEMLDKLPEIDSELLYDLSWQAQEEKLLILYSELINDKMENSFA